MKKADPRLMLIMSMTVFGTLGLFVRNIPVSSGELALYRAVLAALLIGVYLLVSRQKIPFARIKKEVPLLLLSGAAMGVNWILLFEAYRYTSVFRRHTELLLRTRHRHARLPHPLPRKAHGKEISLLCDVHTRPCAHHRHWRHARVG